MRSPGLSNTHNCREFRLKERSPHDAFSAMAGGMLGIGDGNEDGAFGRRGRFGEACVSGRG